MFCVLAPDAAHTASDRDVLFLGTPDTDDDS
jgi:hypothetical protein